jgi:hypothetical protein
MQITEENFTNADVYVQFRSFYTGTLVLQDAITGETLATKTVNNAAGVIFPGAARGTSADLIQPSSSSSGPRVVGMGTWVSSAGIVFNVPTLNGWVDWGKWSNLGCRVTVQVQGSSMIMFVGSTFWSYLDVYVRFGAPYSGPVTLLDAVTGNILATQTVNNATSVIFPSAAHGFTETRSGWQLVNDGYVWFG